jgi:hypothetical protein
MSISELKKLESALGVRLPKSFTDAWRLVKRNCPNAENITAPNLETDVDRLIKINRQIRSKPSDFIRSPKDLAKSWPNELVVCSFSDRFLCYFDSTNEDPEIQYVIAKLLQPKVPSRTPTMYESLGELAKYSIWKFRMSEAFLKRRLRDDGARTKARADRAKVAKNRSFECPDLIAEGWKLAKPTMILKESGKAYAGVIGGDGIVEPTRSGNWQHLFSFQCALVPENPRKLSGVISVYEQDDCLDELAAFHDSNSTLPRKTNGIKLYSSPHQCLPSVGVVLSKGSPAVRAWVKSMGEWVGDLGYFEDNPRVVEYVREFQSNHPHFNLDCHLMLGGWGAVFPESDWLLRMKHTLLASKPSREPWIDVYQVGKQLQVDREVS